MKKTVMFLLLTISVVWGSVNPTALSERQQVFVGFVPGIAAGYDYQLNQNVFVGGSFMYQPDRKNTWVFDDKNLGEFHGVFRFHPADKNLPVSFSLMLGVFGGDRFALQGALIAQYTIPGWEFYANIGYSPRAGVEADYILNKQVKLYFALFNSSGLLGVKFSL